MPICDKLLESLHVVGEERKATENFVKAFELKKHENIFCRLLWRKKCDVEDIFEAMESGNDGNRNEVSPCVVPPECRHFLTPVENMLADDKL